MNDRWKLVNGGESGRCSHKSESMEPHRPFCSLRQNYCTYLNCPSVGGHIKQDVVKADVDINKLVPEEENIKKVIIAARTIQEFLWSDMHDQIGLEEFKRMYRKRLVKID
jgi:hypothetical protein